MSKQTTITIETRSLLILRSKNSTQAWCPACGAQVEMVILENVMPEPEPILAQWLNSGEVLSFESADGSSFICLDSLLARVMKHQTR